MRLSPSLAVLTLFLATPAIAEETRQLGAHEHGRAALNLAIEGAEISMELIAPAADIVGFEHDAETEADRATLATALKDLGAPLALFGPSAEAGCAVTKASAERVELDHDHHEHEHEQDHAETDDHADHDHDHEAEHSEIHAEYLLTCAAPENAAGLALGYFQRFPAAERLDVTVISGKGQQRFETRRGDAALDLSGAL